MSTREWLDSLTKEQLRAWLRIGGVTFKICMGLLKENNFKIGVKRALLFRRQHDEVIMIENKEEYRKQCKKLTDAMSAQFEVVSTVGHLQTLYGDDAKLSDIKKTAEAETKKAIDKLDAFRKEETDAMIAINAKYSATEILGFIANGSDSIDIVNAYLRGDI